MTPVRDRFGPLLSFFRSEVAGGILLIGAAVIAMIWANSAAGDLYRRVLETHVAIPGRFGIDWSLHMWVNDALMTLFFLLVGLEIRREVTDGELAGLRRITGPGVAALGGMMVPALIYVGFNHGDTDALHGWAVPVATDIAFSLAVLRVLGARIPVAAKIFLTALAIMDDLGAILVIALFYTASLDLPALLLAAVLWLALFLAGRAGLRAIPVYLLGGLVLWYLVMRSGVHPTLAGVVLAFAVPMARDRAGSCPSERLETALGGWVGYLILPVFGLANAGLQFDALPNGVWRDPVVPGVILGLFLGKQLGVFGATFLGLRTGLVHLPGRMTLGQLYGVSVLCGIGFTMSLFIADLGFRGQPREDAVRLAVLVGSIVSAVAGLIILSWTTPRRAASVTIADG